MDKDNKISKNYRTKLTFTQMRELKNAVPGREVIESNEWGKWAEFHSFDRVYKLITEISNGQSNYKQNWPTEHKEVIMRLGSCELGYL